VPTAGRSVEDVIAMTYDCNFRGAIEAVDALSEASPDSLKWEFFRSVIQWQRLVYLDSAMVDARDARNAFTTSLSTVIERGERRIAEHPDDTDALFYTGFALGYLAKLDAAEGDEFKAARDGNRGLSYHRTLLKLCPGRIDAYFSRALFNYYTGFLPWYLRPLLFILGESGSKEKAYEYLELVRTRGDIVKYEAEDILGEFYGREDKPDSVRLMYHELISKFPGARLHYYDKMTWVLMDSKHYDHEAAECENAIGESSELRMAPADSAYLGKLCLRLAECYEKLGRDSDAARVYNYMIERSIAPRLSATAHFSLGRLYERTNDRQDAAREYRWIVDRAGETGLVRRARELLAGLGIR
jgi:tetratricopeptide (TPR) repeat protein